MSRLTLTNVQWDDTLRDLEFTDTSASTPTDLQGLVFFAIKVTTGAPTATVGKFIPGAQIFNAVSNAWYKNTGSTASPVWSVVPTYSGTAYITKYAGTATGGTTDTRAYTITGALSTDVATAVIRASTNAVTIQKATLTTNTLTVLFSGDPGANTSVDYTITRVAS